MTKRYYDFATWIRVFAACTILLCHYVVKSGNEYLGMSAQFFNIGVDIFFILSGFLFGTQSMCAGGVLQTGLWYKKRIKRIFVPYELFLIILAVIYCILGIKFSVIKWIRLILGLQGIAPGVQGAEHSWFITSLLFCYLFTPVVTRESVWLEQNSKYSSLAVTLICAIPFFLALVPPAFVSTLLSPFIVYNLAFLLGRRFGQVRLDKKYAVMAFSIMCLAFGIRVIARLFIDGTIWYDRIVAGYTQALAAFCIFYLFAWFFEKKPANNAVLFVSSISFEIYLYHYMFCVGPLKLFGLSKFWVTDCLIITVVTLVVAVLMNRLAQSVTKKIFVKE